MDYRNILATGFLLLCGAVFVHSLKSANAYPQGPNVSMGSNPYESFTGVSSGSSTSLLTVPSNQTFIITTFIDQAANCNLRADSTTVYDYRVEATGYSRTNALTQGRAHISVQAGEELKVVAGNGNQCKYYIEGYYTH